MEYMVMETHIFSKFGGQNSKSLEPTVCLFLSSFGLLFDRVYFKQIRDCDKRVSTCVATICQKLLPYFEFVDKVSVEYVPVRPCSSGIRATHPYNPSGCNRGAHFVVYCGLLSKLVTRPVF